MGLTAKQVSAASGNQKLSDGGGLYLIVRGGRKKWSYIYQRDKRRREMGLGSYPDVSLAEARVRLAEAKTHSEPIEAKARERAEARASEWVFETYALKVLGDRKSHWKPGSGSERSWLSSLTLLSDLSSKRLDEIGVKEVLDVIRPAWANTPEAAHMARMRLEMILDYAAADGLRSGDNPARWRHHLERLLSRRKTLTQGHFKSLPYKDVPVFVQHLRGLDRLAAHALQLNILVAARSKMTLGAEWSEFDLEEAMWKVPALRMKHGRDFEIPLSTQAVDLVRSLRVEGSLLFPSVTGRATVTRVSLSKLCSKIDGTVHGFRSSFKDWAMDETEFGDEVSEQCLAHLVGDATHRAYRRGTALTKRRELMQRWADFLLPAG